MTCTAVRAMTDSQKCSVALARYVSPAPVLRGLCSTVRVSLVLYCMVSSGAQYLQAGRDCAAIRVGSKKDTLPLFQAPRLDSWATTTRTVWSLLQSEVVDKVDLRHLVVCLNDGRPSRRRHGLFAVKGCRQGRSPGPGRRGCRTPWRRLA